MIKLNSLTTFIYKNGLALWPEDGVCVDLIWSGRQPAEHVPPQLILVVVVRVGLQQSLKNKKTRTNEPLI